MNIIKKLFVILTIIFVLLLGTSLLLKKENNTEPPPEITKSSVPDFQKASMEALLSAIIEVESGGNPNAVGRLGERGLCQFMKATWEEWSAKAYGQPLSFDEAFDPKKNRKVGTAYLQYLIDYCKNRPLKGCDEVEGALVCWNWGMGKFRRVEYDYERVPEVVKRYVKRVLDRTRK